LNCATEAAFWIHPDGQLESLPAVQIVGMQEAAVAFVGRATPEKQTAMA
jgi:hypothetical protein